jgi:hypothetical protein
VPAKKRSPRKAVRKRQEVDRPYCSGTMTQSAFFSFLRSALRNKFTRWRPKYDALNAARVPYKGPNKKVKWLYRCAITGELFQMKEVEVDHIVPCGSLRSFDDLPGFAQRLFCEKDGLRVVSKEAHKKITAEQRKKK